MSTITILFITLILLLIINPPEVIGVIIIMVVLFWQLVRITKETSGNNNTKEDPYYTGRNKWTQEQWDNWNPCSKESIDELYKNEFKLDENGNWRYKGDHL
ncbi:MAG: hypothetical protein K9L23_19890 [Desulfotignum sp.]|nr:hypothetical protein [Desulfotignum sp.]